VLGGNGFVGSHICREALERGLSVASLSRFDAFSHWTKLRCSYVGVLGTVLQSELKFHLCIRGMNY